MASYQSPRKSLVALLLTQIEGLPDVVLSKDARLCLRDYGRWLEAQELSRGGDHLLAGLLLNAAEIASYLPAGKLSKGSVELTRLEERIERVLTAARRQEKRGRKGGREDWRREGRRRVPTVVRPMLTQGRSGEDEPDEEVEDDAAEAAQEE